MRDFGGTDAKCLRAAFLGAFKAFDVDIGGKDASKLISVYADGASVNMGKRNGAIITLQNYNPSLLVTDCSLHKLELAVSELELAVQIHEVFFQY